MKPELLGNKCRVKDLYPLTIIKVEENDFVVVSDRSGRMARTTLDKLDLQNEK